MFNENKPRPIEHPVLKNSEIDDLRNYRMLGSRPVPDNNHFALILNKVRDKILPGKEVIARVPSSTGKSVVTENGWLVSKKQDKLATGFVTLEKDNRKIEITFEDFIYDNE